MIETLQGIQRLLALGCFGLLVVMLAAVAVWRLARSGREAGRRVHMGRVGGVMAAVMVAAFVYYGGSKSITFPRTNAEMVLLADDGTSYVSNDVVRVGYARHRILPDVADLNVWRRDAASTNDEDWVAQLVTTVGASPSPVMIDFPAATNYDWIVFTTWQPGPSVQTNGVLHSAWRGVPGPLNVRIFGVPVRTRVLEDGTTIAPPQRSNHE